MPYLWRIHTVLARRQLDPMDSDRTAHAELTRTYSNAHLIVGPAFGRYVTARAVVTMVKRSTRYPMRGELAASRKTMSELTLVGSPLLVLTRCYLSILQPLSRHEGVLEGKRLRVHPHP